MRIHFKCILYTLLILSFSPKVLFCQTNYYLDSTHGNDNNSGKNKLYPLKTIAKLRIIDIRPGDSILFKRGEIWHDQLRPSSGNATNTIYYGAYGVGDLPVITTSLQMNSDTSWIQEAKNIWRCSTLFPTDVGNIIYNHESFTGLKKWSISELENPFDYYYNLKTGELSLYALQNPAHLNTSIVCALRYHIIDYSNVSYAVFENLALKYGSAHGFGGTNASHITIINCEISWIGGGDLYMDGKNQVRYGNGIEFWCEAHDNLVENNKIWEIFDTAVTNQCSSGSNQQNIVYRNNVVWNCGMAALEIWNRPKSSTTKNIYFENNTCVNIGSGWSSEQRSDNLATCFAEFTNEAQTANINIQNNIFYNPGRFFYVYQNEEFFKDMNIDYNCYYADTPTKIISINYMDSRSTTLKNFPIFQQITNNDANSMVANPGFIDTNSNNFHLSSSSACINQGYNNNLSFDHDGNARTTPSGIDIGAYEYIASTLLQQINSTSFVVIPNPCTDYIEIKNRNKVHTIRIYNTKGQAIQSITQPSGKIPINMLPSGIYVIEVNDSESTKRQVLVKK